MSIDLKLPFVAMKEGLYSFIPHTINFLYENSYFSVTDIVGKTGSCSLTTCTCNFIFFKNLFALGPQISLRKTYMNMFCVQQKAAEFIANGNITKDKVGINADSSLSAG